jgi:hypothetical protein
MRIRKKKELMEKIKCLKPGIERLAVLAELIDFEGVLAAELGTAVLSIDLEFLALKQFNNFIK